MKKLLVLLPIIACMALCPLLTGCTGASFAKGIADMGADNAMVQVIYSGVYGPIRVTRLNPKAGQTYNVNTDGSIVVGWTGNTNGNLPAAKAPVAATAPNAFTPAK
jgi:hypothetical protein